MSLCKSIYVSYFLNYPQTEYNYRTCVDYTHLYNSSQLSDMRPSACSENVTLYLKPDYWLSCTGCSFTVIYCGGNHFSQTTRYGFLSGLLTPIIQDTQERATGSSQLADLLFSKAVIGNDLYPSGQPHA